MPRPGPRPYECVRRAWHSDRHQPIRGSLIQEIFRIVNEVHSLATKKNKEWQQKLPIVVLKAEEIMYSKANSEAEYVDVDTLWSRVNDAINTIIRRDESTETGEFLQPCIEAALHLGCPARRSSRSQRNNTPTFYLNPEKNDNLLIPSSNIQGNYVPNNNNNNSSFLPRISSNFLAPNSKVSSPNTCVKSDTPAMQNKIFDQLKFPFSPPNTFSPNVMHQHGPSSSLCSVYPLYYGNQFQFKNSKAGTVCKSNSHLADEADGISAMKNKPSSCEAVAHCCVSEIPQPGNECDLALRLGPVAVPRISSVHNNWPQEVLDGCSCTAKVGSKSGVLSSQTDKGLSYLSMASAHDMLVLSSTRRSYMTQNLGADGALRKRKVNVSHPSEDKQFSWPLKLPFKHFNGSISNAGP